MVRIERLARNSRAETETLEKQIAAAERQFPELQKAVKEQWGKTEELDQVQKELDAIDRALVGEDDADKLRAAGIVLRPGESVTPAVTNDQGPDHNDR